MTIEDLYQLYKQHPSISTDTRRIGSDSLFFALKGSHFDGNKFWKESLDKGAAYAIIDDPQLKNREKCIWVKDVLSTLQALASYHKEKLKIPVIAITGTNGKTTTKELIFQVLSSKYKTQSTHGNLNNHIGVPLTLLSISDKTEMAIIEMGANHIGEIESLCKIANPDFGIITNIGKAHIEGFGSEDGIFQAKTELYQFLALKQGTVFCNKNNEKLYNKSQSLGLKTITYGLSDGAIRGQVKNNNPFLTVTIKDAVDNKSMDVPTNLIGNYNLENVVAAMCIGKYFKVDLADTIKQIEKYKPANMRSQFVKTNRNDIIMDAYNANPTSMQLAIDNFHNIESEGKVMILGDMLELGDISREEHLKITQKIHQLGFKKVFLVGRIFENLRSEHQFPSFKNVEELINDGYLEKIENNYILLKGSRGIGLEKLKDYL